MKHYIGFWTGLLFLVLGFAGSGNSQEKQVSFPGFRMQEIETKLGVGYAVALVDVNQDGKKDIVVVDTTRVVWYENPTWKIRTMIQGKTKPDNVCIAAHDIDGDGLVDFALGAAWKPFEPTGTLQWLKRGKTLEEPWSVYPIDSEPSIHRIRFADIDGDGKPELLSVPLMGKGATNKSNFQDGNPVRIIAYHIPKDPTKDRWLPEILNQELRVIHNFWPIDGPGKSKDVLTASYEGVNLLSRVDDKWTRSYLGTGNQENPKGKRGASEIKQGKLKNGKKVIATIEPWHGDQVVVYSEPTPSPPGVEGKGEGKKLWDRHVIDEQLRWGHGVWFADLDGDGGDELIIGVRDDPGAKDKNVLRRGVRIYKSQDEKGSQWVRQIIEDGGVAVEDLAAVDLNDDGKIDIVAVGRQTHNVRIYWNEGLKK